MFDLEDVSRPMLDGMGNGMAVSGTHHERLQYQQVQSALQYFPLYWGGSLLWHSENSILQKIIYLKRKVREFDLLRPIDCLFSKSSAVRKNILTYTGALSSMSCSLLVANCERPLGYGI